jgi:carboxyl-terminal processing protease
MRHLGIRALALCAGVMLAFNFSAIAQSAAPGTLPIEELRAFTEVFGRIKSDYVESIDDRKLITQAISGMLAGLDPHSSYLDKEEFREMQVGTRGEFGGLGIEVGMEDGLVKVVSPIDDTPASRAGIKSGDLIVKLDDVFVKGMTLNDAVKQMRGKLDTPITLTIARKGEDKPLVFTLKRALIKIQSVKSTLLEPGYAYFRVTQFQGPTGETLANAIQSVFKQNAGPMQGVVLDLRNDPGGLLSGAVAVSAAFLPRNALVVYTDGRTEDAKMRLTASPENYLSNGGQDYVAKLPPSVKDVPMVVLVNGGSASASEIVAGALQDHRRAVIMGTQTFGKASVQTVLPLGDGTAIKLTTARYYTPNGRSIQAKGIVPDIALDDGSRSDPGLKLREADLSKHLANDGKERDAQPATAPAGNTFAFTPAARPQGVDEKDLRPQPGEVVAKSDYELAQAVAFLKSRAVAHASIN